ncbi:tetratricopeptide repeat protein [Bowmanella yangjiangensis]|uniref:TPR domain protein n=1 Tax=Bowmanella yangjiangensis TaxID=2811230 RepID=A0ABS3CME6_9ALTE|nr:tetratricopeptide repeat protein [Bowmanella yangjiangensis]MBN7818268.1 hypothetical protein [Bowmanella yangjiangensis]
MRINNFICILLVLVLCGCQSSPVTEYQAPVYQSFLPTNWPTDEQASEEHAEADLFALSDAQKQHFLAYFHAPENAKHQPHWRLANFLENKLGNFDYRGDTYTAQQAMASNSGNCLSLALITGALAKVVGLKIEFQQVEAAPVYRLETDLLILSRHVRSKVYDPDFILEKQMIYLSKPAVLIDYLPRSGDRYGKRVTEQDVIAMYYQNLAAEALIENDLIKAHGWIRLALAQNELNPSSLATLAVIYARGGHKQQAEQVYLYAMERDVRSLELLDNYRQLLTKQGRNKEAAQVAKKLGNTQDNNPYRWLKLAEQSFAEGNFETSVSYYRKADNIAPYLEEVHLGFAKAYFKLGKIEAAAKALEKAIELSYRAKEKRLYEAKLATLRAIHSEMESDAN